MVMNFNVPKPDVLKPAGVHHDTPPQVVQKSRDVLEAPIARMDESKKAESPENRPVHERSDEERLEYQRAYAAAMAAKKAKREREFSDAQAIAEKLGGTISLRKDPVFPKLSDFTPLPVPQDNELPPEVSDANVSRIPQWANRYNNVN